MDALAWSDTPVDAVIDAIGPARDPSRTPLFQVMFSFHDSAVPDVDFGGLTGAVTERSNGSAKSDLNVIVVPRAAQRLGRDPRPEDDDLTLIWEHSTDLFDDGDHGPDGRALPEPAHRRPGPAGGRDRRAAAAADTESRQLESFSRGPAAGVGYPADATVAALFAAQVARDPDALALVFGARSVSYGELDRRSNALAWVLRRRGVGVDVPVGVAIERGVEFVVALLAVVKAGGAYLPIELGLPAPGSPRWSPRPGPGWS